MPELRYVVLRHTGIAEPHYDLMFETSPGGPLATFRCPVWPPPGKPAGVEVLGDHRREYLDYEGPVSDDRGEVKRVAAGTYRTLERTADRWELILDERLTIGFARGGPAGECFDMRLYSRSSP